MAQPPLTIPADEGLRDVVGSYEEIVKHFNEAKAALARFDNALRAYNAKLEDQIRGTGIDVMKARSSNLLQRQKLKDDLFDHLKNAQSHFGSGKIHDYLRDLEQLVKQLLVVNTLKEEVELLANIVGVRNKISSLLADLLGKMVEIYGDLKGLQDKL